MRKWALRLASVILLAITWGVSVYHASFLAPPDLGSVEQQAQGGAGQWFDKRDNGVHHAVLQGSPFARGRAFGQLAQRLMILEERELLAKYTGVLSFPGIRHVFETLALRWFIVGAPPLDQDTLAEMYGVSLSVTDAFDRFGDAFNRQIYYHGVHELGQMFVDQRRNDMGCTVVAVPGQKGWTIGRVFDFEGGRIFDEEKIVKWAFPDRGVPYVSVIWAGMVGAVTGVNAKGVYVSMNAAGSDDRRRYGIPSTLVVTQALEQSHTAREAADVIARARLIVSGIFVTTDPTTRKAFRVEKSPTAVEVIDLDQPTVITNHLKHPRWKNDKTNHFRQHELTSNEREQSGFRRLNSLKDATPEGVLGVMRDKNGRHLGHRAAIDALIATHAVVYDYPTLYVSQGPGVSGPLLGFDLAKSFAARRPVRVRDLPRDPLVSTDFFNKANAFEKLLVTALARVRGGRCEPELLGAVEAKKSHDTYLYRMFLGDYFACQKNQPDAKVQWTIAKKMRPAYASEQDWLQKQGVP